jgi:hypothetical protein
MNNNLIPYESLGLTESRLEIIDQFLYYKHQVESFESEIKEKFKDLVESGEIPVSSIDLGGMILSYKKGYIRKSIDTDKLKEDGLYEKYLKNNEVLSSVSMTIKKEEK